MDEREMRVVYSETLCKIARENPLVYLLEADLMGSMSTQSFQKEFPDRLINCGIMEAEMIGVAAGLSLTGKIPFVHTFSSFLTRRAYDQLYLSLAYADQNAVLIGSDAGIGAEHNGGTHTSFEDIGLMRMLPTCIVMDMSDQVMFEAVLRSAAANPDLYYLRTVRKQVPAIYPAGETFEIGQAKVLLEEPNAEVTIIACGIMVDNALKAAAILKEKGIDANVVDMFTIQPLDQETVLRFAKSSKCIITAENHYVQGGLGSAVSEVLAENACAVPLVRVGVNQIYGQVGQREYLEAFYHLTTDDIVAAVMNGPH